MVHVKYEEKKVQKTYKIICQCSHFKQFGYCKCKQMFKLEKIKTSFLLKSFVYISFSLLTQSLTCIHYIHTQRTKENIERNVSQWLSFRFVHTMGQENCRKCTSFLYCKQNKILVELMIGLCYYPTLKTLLFQGKANVNKYLFICLLVYLTLSGVVGGWLHCLSSDQNIINMEI